MRLELAQEKCEKIKLEKEIILLKHEKNELEINFLNMSKKYDLLTLKLEKSSEFLKENNLELGLF